MDLILRTCYLKVNVYGLVRDNRNKEYCKNLAFFGIQKNIKLLKGNIENPEFLNRELKKLRPTEIYNLAAFSSVGKSWNNPIFDG